MKQHITEDQWNEIGIAQKLTIATWRSEKRWDSSLLTIGQMIEFLDEHEIDWVNELYYSSGPRLGRELVKSFGNQELCDALWEAVKEVLEK